MRWVCKPSNLHPQPRVAGTGLVRDVLYLCLLLLKRVAGVTTQRHPSCAVLDFFLQEEKVVLIKHFISVAYTGLDFSQLEADKQQVPLSKRIINRQILSNCGGSR